MIVLAQCIKKYSSHLTFDPRMSPFQLIPWDQLISSKQSLEINCEKKHCVMDGPKAAQAVGCYVAHCHWAPFGDSFPYLPAVRIIIQGRGREEPCSAQATSTFFQPPCSMAIQATTQAGGYFCCLLDPQIPFSYKNKRRFQVPF